MDTIVGPWNNEADEDQSEDEDSDTSTDVITGPNQIGGIPEGDPYVLNNELSASIDEDISDEFFPGAAGG